MFYEIIFFKGRFCTSLLTKLHDELDAWLYTRHDGRVITIDGTLPPNRVYEAFVRALGTVPGLLPT